MSGRYGMDPLNNVLMILCFAVLIVNTLIKTPILGGLSWALIICAIYRTYSRNTYKRAKENEKFLALWKPIRRKLSTTLKRIRQIRTHRFRTCPNCKALIEMPRRKGLRVIKCPRCRTQFETRISI